MLPFGLRSAPKILSAVADTVQWILSNNGIRKRLHYLDDFNLVAKSLNLVVLVSRVGSTGCSIEPLPVAHMVTDVFLSIDAQSAGEQTMAEGTVQKR